jgi:hypothetical protein
MTACRFRVKVTKENGKKRLDPNGTEVDSILYAKLRNKMPEKQANLLYRKVAAVKGPFIEINGDPYKGPYDQENNPEGYRGKTDVNGEPLYKDVMKFNKLDTLMNERQNLGKKNVLTRGMAALQASLNAIELQLNAFKRSREKEKLSDELEGVKNKLLEKLRDGDEKMGLLEYAQNALKYTESTLDKLKALEKARKDPTAAMSKKLTAQKLQELYEYSKSFANIDQVIKDVESGWIQMDVVEMQDGTIINPLQILKDARDVREEIENRYKDLSIQFIVEQFAPNSRQAEMEYREKVRNEYIEKNPWKPGEKIEAYDKKVKEFVDEQVRNADKDGLLLEQSMSFLEEQLTSVKGDIDFLQRWMINALETNDFILRQTALEVNAQSDRARLDFQAKAAQLHKIWEEMVEYQKKQGVDTKDPLKLYDLLLEEVDGEKTGYYTSQYKSTFYTEMREAIKKKQEITDEQGEKAGLKYWTDWTNENRAYQNAVHTVERKDKQGNIIVIEQEVLKTIMQDHFPTQSERGHTVKSYLGSLAKKANKTGDWARYRSVKRRIERELDKKELRLFIPSVKNRSKYKNPQWEKLQALGKDKTNPLYRFYKAILSTKRIADSRVPASYQLGYKLGGKRKTFWEKWDSMTSYVDLFGFHIPLSWGQLWTKVIKPEVKETFSITEEDVELGDVDKIIKEKDNKTLEVSVNAEMEESQYIPLHFRGDPGEAQSFEVMSNILAVYNTAANYHYLNQLLPYLEMIKWHMKKRDHTKTKGWSELVAGRLTGDVRVTKQGEYSNAYDALIDFIDQRIYGVTRVDPGIELFGVNFMKVVNAWMTYVGMVVLGGNWLSAKANWNLAQVLTWIEGMGGEHYTAKDVAMAEKKYMLDLGHIFNDVGRVRPKSKTNLLDEIFDPLNDFNYGQYNYADNARWKRLASLNSAHFLNNMAEHNVQNLTMYSILNGTKVMANKEEYLTKSGEKTKDRSKAMSLDEAYIKKGDRLVLDSNVKYIDSGALGKLRYEKQTKKNAKRETIVVDHRRNADIKLTNAMQQINYDLHGAYSLRNSPPFQRLIIGALALMLRKFLPPAVQRRFTGGMGFLANMPKYLKGETEDLEGTTRFRTGTNTLFEGQYITTLKVLPRLLKSMVIDLGKMSRDLQRADWSKLSKHERANIKRTIGEFGVAAAMFTLGAVFRGKAEDDDDNAYLYYLSFQANRLYTELAAYVSITEAMRILQSPMASITMIERIQKLIFQLSEDVLWNTGEFEKYESGSRKGNYKITKSMMDVIPFWKHTERHKYLSDIVNYYYK